MRLYLNVRKSLHINDLDFIKGNGLIPVIVQDCRSLIVLSLEYVNKTALEKTLLTKFAHYYDFNSNSTFKKGSKSDNVQRIIEVLVNCSKNALIFQVEQKGLACESWMKSCFHNHLNETESPS